jgi:hypothetical protein
MMLLEHKRRRMKLHQLSGCYYVLCNHCRIISISGFCTYDVLRLGGFERIQFFLAVANDTTKRESTWDFLVARDGCTVDTATHLVLILQTSSGRNELALALFKDTA